MNKRRNANGKTPFAFRRLFIVVTRR
jgi:trans-aconitate methyltransferase